MNEDDYDPKELESKSPSELTQRRSEIVSQIASLPGSHNEAPTRLLQELAFITSTLRRKTAGPPKKASVSKRSTPASTDDLAGMLD